MVLNDAGVIGLTLNGKSFPATEPIVLETGDWVVGALLQRGAADPPDAPAPVPPAGVRQGRHPARPAVLGRHHQHRSRRAVLGAVHVDDPGVWVWHCHILNHVESETGMFGMVTAVIVQDPEAT